MENYYTRPEVSNSDLTWLKKLFIPEQQYGDIVRAYAMGSLIDAMITEPDRVDYFKFRLKYDEYQFTNDDFEVAKEMKKAFQKDTFCQQMIKQCSFQKISIKHKFPIVHEGLEFTLNARCKWDLFCEKIDLGGDIKSTTATTQKQAEEAFRYFDYDRSRAWYMDLENRSNDIVIFISKVNFKIFKVPVKRNDELYREGKAKYQGLAYKWWTLFEDLKIAA